MKLALGTVQLGLPYGINNTQGVPSSLEIKEIFDLANHAGINLLDTAMEYGDSELKIGEFSSNRFNVVTKLPQVPLSGRYDKSWLFNSINSSLSKLKSKSIYGVLLHRPSQLFESFGAKLYEDLLSLKAEKLVEKIGISIYEPSELDNILTHFDFDIVQSPFNILDNRLLTSGWLNRLNSQEVEVHIRSVFLQGLLLMDGKFRPLKFDKWNSVWDKYDSWIKENNSTSIEACLSYVNSFDKINKVIVGVDNKSQLQAILNSNTKLINERPIEFDDLDSRLLSPSNWNDLN